MKWPLNLNLKFTLGILNIQLTQVLLKKHSLTLKEEIIFIKMVHKITVSTPEFYKHTIRSDQISRSVVSDSSQPHESQHARPPCRSPTPGVPQTHVHRVGDAIQPSHPLSSPSPPAPNPSQHQSLFQ